MKKLSNQTLLIDAGNTSLKWAIFDGASISEQQRCYYTHSKPIKQFQTLLENQRDNFSSITLVSVLGETFNQQIREIALKFCASFNLIQSLKSLKGITNAYDEPHKLGSDRFIAMIGAYHLSNLQQKNKKACIIIDTGTATTIDAVNAEGHHLGGLILPGIDLCNQSLLNNTQQLSQWGTPENQKQLECKVFASNTVDAIYSASILGLSGAIEKITAKMERKLITNSNTDIQIDRYLCGGTAKLVLPHLDSTYTLQEDLIMQGLKIVAER